MSDTSEFARDSELAAFLQYLPKQLSSRHHDCNCLLCKFDNLVIKSVEHIYHLFDAELLLLINNRHVPADLMVRPIAELITDILFINLDISERFPPYIAYDSSYEIWRCDKIIQHRKLNGQPTEDVERLRTERLELLAKENLKPLKKLTSWTNVRWLDRIEKIIQSKFYPFDISFKQEHIDYLHKITHCSGIQIARRNAYHTQEIPSTLSIALTIDWIMVLLEFIKFHFNFNSLEQDIKKFHRLYYIEWELE